MANVTFTRAASWGWVGGGKRCDIFLRGLGLHVFNQVLLRFSSLDELQLLIRRFSGG